MDGKAWVASLAILLLSHYCFLSNAAAEASNKERDGLDRIRIVLERQEDSIIFGVIERAKFPINSKAYEEHIKRTSLAQLFVRQTEALQAQFGRYENPEEIPFFPEQKRPHPIVPPYNLSGVVLALHPVGARVNVSSEIWEFYIKKFLPLLTTQGQAQAQAQDDGNYASTLASDLTCLQALSRRIHYGRFVAEAKFMASPHLYIPPIRSNDQRTLLKLLTNDKVEWMVKQRVAKKAMVFGQDVTLNTTVQDNTNSSSNYKVDPALLSSLYSDWVIPLTKVVELQYLLRRLD